MNDISMDVEIRNTVGNGSANRLRNSGYIPGVIYGKDMEATPIQIESSVFSSYLRHYGQNTVYNINLNNQNIQTVIQDIQICPLKKEYMHVDLHRVSLNEKREAQVPIRLVGKSKLERQGAVFDQQIDFLTVKGFPQDIPEYIEINVSDMKVGNSLKVGEVIVPENLDIINGINEVIVSLTPPKPVTEDLNLQDNTPANAVPIIGNDERKTNAT